MSLEKRIDDLIEAGWQVLATGFEPMAVETWRKRVIECLSLLTVCDDPDTRDFTTNLQEQKRKNLVVGGAILSAASGELRKNFQEKRPPGKFNRLECPARVYQWTLKRLRNGRGPNARHQTVPSCPRANRRPFTARVIRRKRG